MQKRKLSLQKRLKNNARITAPKKNAGRSISFLPTIGRFAKVCYFYVGKKSTAFRQLINIVSVENISVSNPHFF